MLTASLHERTCSYEPCGRRFMQQRPLQNVCGPVCARRKVQAERKAKEEKAKAERKADRAKLLEHRRLPYFIAKAQDAFNAFIRERDRDLPCVSCGMTNPPKLAGGQWDAGHFLGVGSHPELRFNEDNCHKQCKPCNGGGGRFSHKARTVNADYERGLLERIGPERLAALKGPHQALNLTKADAIQLAATYRAKRRELIEQRKATA